MRACLPACIPTVRHMQRIRCILEDQRADDLSITARTHKDEDETQDPDFKCPINATSRAVHSHEDGSFRKM